MARGLYRLSARQVATQKHPGMLSDGGGLYLRTRVNTDANGDDSYLKSWVFIFFLPRRREMGLGSIRAVDLVEARRLADAGRAMVQAKIDPIGERERLEKRRTEAENQSPVLTFGTYADAYVEKLGRDPKTLNNWRRTVKVHCAPIRNVPLDQIGTAEIMSVVGPLMKRLPVSGEKALTYIRKILAAARVEGLRKGDNPAAWKDNIDHLILDKAKPLTARGHHKALPYAEMPAFMNGLTERAGTGARALEFLILTVMRTTEVIGAVWSEVDIDARIWKVPAERMKMGRGHRVALSAAAVGSLEALPRGEANSFIFPGTRDGLRLDTMSMTAVLRRMGVKDRSTVHGFRSTFRDWVGEETEFDTVLAETALAHRVGTEVEQAYSRGDALEKRFTLMEAWADFCAGRSQAALRDA